MNESSNARINKLEAESSIKEGVIIELRSRISANSEVEQQLVDRIESVSTDLIRANVLLESSTNIEIELAAKKQALETEKQNRHSAEVLLGETETLRVAAERRAAETKEQIDKLLSILESRNAC